MLQAFVSQVVDPPVGVNADSVAHLAAHQRVARNSVVLACYVPQGGVEGGDGCHIVCAAAEER